MRRTIVLVSCLLSVVMGQPASSQEKPTSAEVIARARSFAEHPWHCSAENLVAECSEDYRSVYVVGDHLGLPYDPAGFSTLDWFDKQIAAGLGAGSFWDHGILSCTVGLDCSGFVSQCWKTHRLDTPDIPQCTRPITREELKRGDALLFPWSETFLGHVVLFSHLMADGRPFLYESNYYNVRATTNMGWAYVSGYTPVRYLDDTDDETAPPLGTGDTPIAIDHFPYLDRRDTRESVSDSYDTCAGAPEVPQIGPEYLYAFDLGAPGRLTASIEDGPDVDVDLDLYEYLNRSDCLAWADETLDLRLDCGSYYLMVDTRSPVVGQPIVEPAGFYDLVVDFQAEETPCGERPGYEYLGQLGSECIFPGNPTLPFCNANLGATVCLYTGDSPSDESFCSVECDLDDDCQGPFPGGCCQYVNNDGYDGGWNPVINEDRSFTFCVPADLCGEELELLNAREHFELYWDDGAEEGGDLDLDDTDAATSPDVEHNGDEGCGCVIRRPSPASPAAWVVLALGLFTLGCLRRRR